MILFSIDQALGTSGWAQFDDNRLLDYGSFTIDSNQSIDERLMSFRDIICGMYRDKRFNEVVFEGIQYQNNAETYKKLAYVQAVLMMWCNDNEVPYTVIPPGVWRSELCCNFGRTRKEQKQKAIEFVKETFAVDATSDEADAICMGWAYLSMKKKEGELAW